MPVPAPPVGGSLAGDISKAIAGFGAGREEKRRVLFEEGLRKAAGVRDERRTAATERQGDLMEAAQTAQAARDEEAARATGVAETQRAQQLQMQGDELAMSREAHEISVGEHERKLAGEEAFKAGNAALLQSLMRENGDFSLTSPDAWDNFLNTATQDVMEAKLEQQKRMRDDRIQTQFRNTQLRVQDLATLSQNIFSTTTALTEAKFEMAKSRAANMEAVRMMAMRTGEEDVDKLMAQIEGPQMAVIEEMTDRLTGLLAQEIKERQKLHQMNSAAFSDPGLTEEEIIKQAREEAKNIMRGPAHWDGYTPEQKQTLSDDLMNKAFEVMNNDPNLADLGPNAVWDAVDQTWAEEAPAFQMFERGRVPTVLFQQAILQYQTQQTGQVVPDPAGAGLAAPEMGRAGITIPTGMQSADPNSNVVMPEFKPVNALPDPMMADSVDTTKPRRPGSKLPAPTPADSVLTP